MPWGPIGGIEVVLYSFFNLGARLEWSTARPDRFTPPSRKRPCTHYTGGWVGHRVGLDACGKSRPPPGFDPRSFQRRYTHWAIPTHVLSAVETLSQEAVLIAGGPTCLLLAIHQTATLCWFGVQREFVIKLFVMLKSVFEPRTSCRILRVWVRRKSSAFAAHAAEIVQPWRTYVFGS